MSTICNPKVADGNKKDAFWGGCVNKSLSFLLLLQKALALDFPKLLLDALHVLTTMTEICFRFFFISKKTAKMPIFDLQAFGPLANQTVAISK